MIQEIYVSFKTAKFLKQKGFDEPTLAWYTQEGILLNRATTYKYNSDKTIPKHGDFVAAPTQSMTMKWLREIYKLSIEPYYDIALSWAVDIKYIGKYTNYNEFEEVRSQTYNSYEQACEEAINYCLENLVKV